MTQKYFCLDYIKYWWAWNTNTSYLETISVTFISFSFNSVMCTYDMHMHNKRGLAFLSFFQMCLYIVSERKLKIRYFFFKNTKYTRTYTNATLILSLIGIAIKHHSWKKKDENKIIGFHISYFKIKLKVQTVTSRSLHSRNEGKFSTDLSLRTWAGCCVVRVTVINLSPSCLSITTPNKAIYATCNFRL